MPMIGDTLYLPEIEINAINKYEPQTFGGGGGDSDFSHSHTGQLINVATRTYILSTYPPLFPKMLRIKRRALQRIFSRCPNLLQKALLQ